MKGPIKFIFVILVLATGLVLFDTQTQAQSTASTGAQRFEQEDKLQVPLDKMTEVWAFLKTRFVDDQAFLKSIDPLLSASSDQEENFTDTYFDTPTLQALSQQTGVRHRYRENLTNPNDPKNGRDIMQIKTSNVNANALVRGTIKFDIKYPKKIVAPEDANPMLGIVDPKQRQEFRDKLTALGLNPDIMKPIINLPDDRKRLYIYYNNEPTALISMSFDHVQARLFWAKADFCEIEPELRQTVALNDPNRDYYSQIQDKIIAEIKNQFPWMQSDPTPKYNKAFNIIEKQIPFLRWYIQFGNGLVALAGIVLIAIGWGVVFAISKIKKFKLRNRGS